VFTALGFKAYLLSDINCCILNFSLSTLVLLSVEEYLQQGSKIHLFVLWSFSRKTTNLMSSAVCLHGLSGED
jgi:hypothetical protein